MAAKKKSGANKSSPINSLPPANPQAKGGIKLTTNTPKAPKGGK